MANKNKGIRKLGHRNYKAWYRDARGKQHEKSGFETIAAAERWRSAELDKIDRGEWVDPKRGRLTVGAWADKWLAGKVDLKPSTSETYRSLIEVQIKPTWATVPLVQVNNEDVAAWVGQMSRNGLSASRVRQAHTIFNSMMAAAVAAKRLAANPAKVKLPTLPLPDHQYLTRGELDALAAAVGPEHACLIHVLGELGLRFGEAVALRKKHVDVLAGRMTIRESATEVKGVMTFTSPKTHQQRVVSIPSSMREMLARQMENKQPDDRVFASPRGDVLREMNWRRRVFDPAAARIGRKGLRPHELRHTAASLAIAAGGDVIQVQRMLGHADAATTLRVYAHLLPTGLDDLAAKLDHARQSSTSRIQTRDIRGLDAGNVVEIDAQRQSRAV